MSVTSVSLRAKYCRNVAKRWQVQCKHRK